MAVTKAALAELLRGHSLQGQPRRDPFTNDLAGAFEFLRIGIIHIRAHARSDDAAAEGTGDIDVFVIF
jgi:hypothetical protein